MVISNDKKVFEFLTQHLVDYLKGKFSKFHGLFGLVDYFGKF